MFCVVHPRYGILHLPAEQAESRIIDRQQYILIPAEKGLEVNGLSVDWA